MLITVGQRWLAKHALPVLVELILEPTVQAHKMEWGMLAHTLENLSANPLNRSLMYRAELVLPVVMLVLAEAAGIVRCLRAPDAGRTAEHNTAPAPPRHPPVTTPSPPVTGRHRAVTGRHLRQTQTDPNKRLRTRKKGKRKKEKTHAPSIFLLIVK